MTAVLRHGRCQRLSLRKIVKTDTDWRRELTSSEYAVARRAATELPFSNRYWHNQKPGTYFCTCCGTALFLSRDNTTSSFNAFQHKLKIAQFHGKKGRHDFFGIQTFQFVDVYFKLLNPTAVQKPLRNIHQLTSKIFRHILPKYVVCRAR